MQHLSHPLVLLAIAILGPLLRDLVVGLLKSKAKELLTDKNPGNDTAGKALADAASAIERLKLSMAPTPPPKR